MYFKVQKHQLLLFVFLFSFVGLSARSNSLKYKASDKSVVKLKADKFKDGSKVSSLESRYDLGNGNEIFTVFSGKYNQQAIGAARTSYFSDIAMNDRVVYLRSTVDFSLDIAYGPKGQKEVSRIQTHNTFRLRNKWGSSTEVSTDSITAFVGEAVVTDPAAHLKKHVVYTRELWMKIMLGDLQVQDDFIQFGLVPYSLGRGVALGSAYKQSGFLGFSPGFSVDQFAPGVVVRYDMFPKKVSFDAYFSLLENYHTSYKSNNETIRSNEILTGGASTKRGTHSHVYVAALRSNVILFERGDKEKLSFEPYFVCQHAPDQKIEFDNDSESFLKSFGVASEFSWNRFQCGGEIGFNMGVQNIRAWDRNEIKLRRNTTTGAVEHYYTKVYDSNALTTESTVLEANKLAVAASVRDPKNNSSYNSAGALTPVSITDGVTTLYNGVDRFRPQQKKHFNGWFALFDASYDITPKSLTFVVGTGWSSGQLDKSTDLNGVGEGTLMNQSFSGFIPMQSVYSGTRLRHLIMVNSSTPRFSQKTPWESTDDLAKKNVLTPVGDKELINSFVNLYFVGCNLEWSVQSLKKYKLKVCPNIVHYWSPDSPLRKDGSLASPSLGTELTVEASVSLFDRLKIKAYTGVLLPGEQYRQMKEDGATVNKVLTGNSPAYVFNIGATFSF